MSRDRHVDRLSITLSQDSKRAQDASVRDLGLAGVVGIYKLIAGSDRCVAP